MYTVGEVEEKVKRTNYGGTEPDEEEEWHTQEKSERAEVSGRSTEHLRKALREAQEQSAFLHYGEVGEQIKKKGG